MQGMRAGILRAESAARGCHAVATDPAFRAIVASAYADTRNDFDALRSLVRDNPLQEARLDQIDPLLVRRHGELQHIIDSASISSSERSALVREGERVADQLNAITADMFADEKRLLGERQQKARHSCGRQDGFRGTRLWDPGCVPRDRGGRNGVDPEHHRPPRGARRRAPRR